MARKTKHNEITSPELLAQVNPSNIRLKNDFLDYLKSVQRSPKTIVGYSNDLDIALVWNHLYNGDKDFVKISKRDWAAYQNWLINTNGNSPARVRRLKSAISSLSNYITNVLDDEEEFQNFKPSVRKIENPVLQPVRNKTVWSDEDLDDLLDKLTERGEHKKACALALAMCSGRRKAELCLYKVDYFKDENLVCDGALYKTSEPIKTKGFGLGKFIYCYTLAKRFRPYFEAWMKEREELGIESEWLFPSAENPAEHIKESTMNSWAATFSRITGKDYYWHSVRHYTTTYLAKSGLPDSAIVEFFGWESSQMVNVYNDTEADEKLAQFFKDGEIDTSSVKTISAL